MEAKTALYRIQQTQKSATIQDAEAFLDACEEAGLVPFEEMHCLITDYDKRDGTHVHSMSTKRHYAVSHRWARQNGGYTIRVDRGWVDNGNYHHEVSIVNNNDYAAVSRLASSGGWSRQEIESELRSFYVTTEGIVTANEAQRKTAETGLSPDKKARKRALEAAEKAMFGIEPGRARELYTAIAGSAREAAAALYGTPEPHRESLPAPVVEVVTEPQPVEEVKSLWPEGIANMNGARMSPDSIKASLMNSWQRNTAQETNERRRGLFCSKLEACFDGDTAAKESARKLVTWWLFEADNEGRAKSLTEGQTRAWLAEYVAPAIEGDKYPLQPFAKLEMAAVYHAALKATAQAELERRAASEAVDALESNNAEEAQDAEPEL